MTKVILAVILIIAVHFLFFRESEAIHYHAGFQVYKDNQLLDYSGLEYMHLEPCNEVETKEEPTAEHEQEEKAHLHDNVGDVVHVHAKGAVWGDLFKNINVEINPKEAYVNGKLTDEILNYPIKEYDSVVIFQGENDNIAGKLAGGVTRDHIIDTESASENCGS